MNHHPDLNLLADLDAGLLDADRAREVRATALADPSARAVLHALTATRAELAAAPPVPVPPGVTDRWAAALDAAALLGPQTPVPTTDRPRPDRTIADPTADPAMDLVTPGPAAARPDAGSASADAAPGSGRAAATTPPPISPPVSPPSSTDPRTVPPLRPPGRRDPGRPPGRRPGGRWRLPRPAITVGVVLVAVLVAAGLLHGRVEALPTVAGVDLAGAGLQSLGVRDPGEFADPARRAACLRSVAPSGGAPDAPLLGGRRVTFDGQPGVLLVLGTGELGAFRVVVVSPSCDAKLADARVGR